LVEEQQQQQQADATTKPDQPSKTAPTDVSAALAKYEAELIERLSFKRYDAHTHTHYDNREVAELESESEFGNFQVPLLELQKDYYT